MGSHFNWNDPVFNAGDFFKFNNKGDNIAGEIEDITTFTFPDKEKEDGSIEKGSTVPQLRLRIARDQVMTVTASNAHLLEQIRSKAPQVGDGIDITYVDDAGTKYGGKKKMFLVKVIKGTQSSESAYKADPPF